MPKFVIAHRGASGYFCENTAAAFASAYGLGVRHVEIDCMLCGDGDMVLFHDDDLWRLAGVRVAPPHSDLATLRRYDLRFNYKGEGAPPPPSESSPPAQKILTVAEFLLIAERYDFRVNFEIKPGLGDGKANGIRLAEILNAGASHLRHKPLVSSFDFGALASFSEAVRIPVSYALLYNDLRDDFMEWVSRLGAEAVHLHNECCSLASISRVRERGLRVGIFTVNSQSEASRFWSLDADYLFSDFPDKIENGKSRNG